MRTYKSPMLTPSPLRRRPLRPADSDTSVDGELGLETPIDPEDIFGSSPYRGTAPLKSFDAHLRSSAHYEREEEEEDDDERVFLSTPAPAKRGANANARMRTPVNKHTPMRARPHSTAEPTPLPAAFQHRTPLRVNTAVTGATLTTGMKRKSQDRANSGALTPLSVTKAAGEGSLGRLAPLPLPAPKFRTRDESEQFLGRAGTMDGLRIGGDGSAVRVNRRAARKDHEEAVDVSPGGHVAKRRAKDRPLSQELKRSSAGSVNMNTLVAFPSAAADTRRRTLSNESNSSSSHVRPRQRLSHGSNVSTHSRTKSGAQSLSRASTLLHAASPAPVSRPPAPRRMESNGSATMLFGPSIPQASTPARNRPRYSAAFEFDVDSPPPTISPQTQMFARHSYAGPSASPRWGIGRSSSPSLPRASDDEPMGEISDEEAMGSEHMPEDIRMIADMDENLEGMDEEDLFFASSSFRSAGADEGVATDPDDSFSWGSAQNQPSMFSINVTASTPSPRKPAHRAMIEKKFKPRDSGIGLTDEEDALRAPAAPETRRQGFGIGRSGSVSMMPPPLMVASSSASTTASSDLDSLFTPGFGPSASSGWPSFASTPASSVGSDLLNLLSADDSANSMNRFIARTLAGAQAPPAPGKSTGGEPRRAAPDTPQKRVRAADRAWHSAFTAKVGFDYTQDGEAEEQGDVEGGKKKKKPRKSLPAAFPTLSMGRAKPKLMLSGLGGAKGKNAGARVGESDLESDASDSPEKHAAGGSSKYAGLGLGRPQRPGAWLMRRSSSGAISTHSSGESSWPATPTAASGSGKSGWQLPPPRIPPAASPASTQPRLPSRLSPAASTRTASSSSTSTATASPLGSRLLQVNTTAARMASPLKSTLASVGSRRDALRSNTTGMLPATTSKASSSGMTGGGGRRGRPSLPAMPLSSDARPGRFEAEFVEAGEIGSGEFGRVMRVRLKTPAPRGTKEAHLSPAEARLNSEENEWAVKRSKRFEGARHRLRLREEVDVLRHLARAYESASGSLGARHPNVLAIVDAWEEDEALFIRTELCALGSFSRFLWEFGRAFERLDESRVWKIVADLSNGLAFVHAAGVIHLDLKPANIFVTASGRFKLGDFGMATLWPRSSTPMPHPPAAAGEEHERPPGFEREGDKCYLAPEVLQGRYGPAADMFSLGITLLETAANIVVPDQGEQWHRLRRDDLSGVDLGGSSAALVGLLGALLCSDPHGRPDAQAVCAHPVVARTREAMEAAGAVGSSPLAPVPAGFLAHVLGDLDEKME